MNDVAAFENKDSDYRMEGELVELGQISEDTKGGGWGTSDGGGGLCLCR